jgi:hypothetical protein
MRIFLSLMKVINLFFPFSFPGMLQQYKLFKGIAACAFRFIMGIMHTQIMRKMQSYQGNDYFIRCLYCSR